MKGLLCCDYWPKLCFKQRQNLQTFWATCVRLSRTSLSSHLSHSLGLCLKAVDQTEKKIYPKGTTMKNKCLTETPGCLHSACESKWKWVKMPDNFKGFQPWGCLLNEDRTCGFIILFYVSIMLHYGIMLEDLCFLNLWNSSSQEIKFLSPR